MSIQNKQVVISGPKGDVRPLIVRIGGPDVEEYECPEYPKWVTGESGKPVLVEDAGEEKAATQAQRDRDEAVQRDIEAAKDAAEASKAAQETAAIAEAQADTQQNSNTLKLPLKG